MYKKSLYLLMTISTLCYCFGQVGAEEEASSCQYLDKLEQCKIANKNGTTRNIEEFLCLASSRDEEILYQIILDEKFKEIQEEQLDFLVKLKKDKKAIVLDGNKVQDSISKNFDRENHYHRKYKQVCNSGILEARAECGDISIVGGEKIIQHTNTPSDCLAMAEVHLDIYKEVAYNIVKQNKQEVKEDQYKKDITQVLRGKFEGIASVMTDIVGFLGRLARGITHWTGNPKQ